MLCLGRKFCFPVFRLLSLSYFEDFFQAGRFYVVSDIYFLLSVIDELFKPYINIWPVRHY